MATRDDGAKGVGAKKVALALLVATGAVFWATLIWGLVDHLDVRIRWVPTSEAAAARR